MPEISVIIPTCSDKVPLKACLLSLLYQSIDPDRIEIILVNNGGRNHRRDFIEPLIKEIGIQVRLFDTPKNLGYAGGCRFGADQALGELLLFHNDDAIIDPAWLALALAEFRRMPDLGVITCRIVDASGPRVQHEGVTQTLPNALFWQTGWGEKDGPNRCQPCGEDSSVLESTSHLIPRHSIDLDFFSGCIWGTPQKVWKDVGGLGDLYHPGYYEDTEYGLRCRQLGYRIRLLTQVTCSHYGSMTLGSTSNAYWIAFYRSRMLFLLRNRTGFHAREILKTEWMWWTQIYADSHPITCLIGWLTALPRIPWALSDRTRFRRKCFSRL